MSRIDKIEEILASPTQHTHVNPDDPYTGEYLANEDQCWRCGMSIDPATDTLGACTKCVEYLRRDRVDFDAERVHTIEEIGAAFDLPPEMIERIQQGAREMVERLGPVRDALMRVGEAFARFAATDNGRAALAEAARRAGPTIRQSSARIVRMDEDGNPIGEPIDVGVVVMGGVHYDDPTEQLPRPVANCGHVDPDDGTCAHPDALTPECWDAGGGMTSDCPMLPPCTRHLVRFDVHGFEILEHPVDELTPCNAESTFERMRLPDGRMQVQGLYRETPGGEGYERVGS